MITKQKIVSLMDLTQLGDNDTNEDIMNLCSKAKNSLGEVAAICVFKEFIPVVKKQLGQDFKVATVVNFPNGDSSLAEVVSEAKEALELGADEIDVVIDYNQYIKTGESSNSCEIINSVKELCGDKVLKVIIESGELNSNHLIEKASVDVIANGANFIKTSTGKTPIGATLGAAKIMLETISNNDAGVGFKASGGIRNYDQAIAYINLADTIINDNYVNASKFRFGVSGLLDNLLEQTKEDTNGY